MASKWKKLSSAYVLETPWLSVRKDNYRTPQRKAASDHYVVERSNFIVVVLRTRNNKFILVRQYRCGAGREIINFPMGFIEDGEQPREAAQRELFEELGLQVKGMKFLGSFLLAPTFTTMKGYVFAASHVGIPSRIGEDEITDFVLMGSAQVEKLLKKPGRTDFVTAVAYLLDKEAA
ncbi:MAG: NUDIX hydrolase [Patescibacteria group bacterium]|nr:NUDIX hydrolase [Patescibacteria group bacterium]